MLMCICVRLVQPPLLFKFPHLSSCKIFIFYLWSKSKILEMCYVVCFSHVCSYLTNDNAFIFYPIEAFYLSVLCLILSFLFDKQMRTLNVKTGYSLEVPTSWMLASKYNW